MSLADSLQKLNDLDLSEIDFDNMGSWPLAVRIFVCILTLLLILGGGVSVLSYQFAEPL